MMSARDMAKAIFILPMKLKSVPGFIISIRVSSTKVQGARYRVQGARKILVFNLYP
jgi:hypothetical protein